MKQQIALVFLVFGLALATEHRLPLPGAIQATHPRLVNEPLTSDMTRIVGGKNVTNGGAPHQVAIFRSGAFLCGGALIGSKTVLTAAHCVYGQVNEGMKYTSGSLNDPSWGRDC